MSTKAEKLERLFELQIRILNAMDEAEDNEISKLSEHQVKELRNYLASHTTKTLENSERLTLVMEMLSMNHANMLMKNPNLRGELESLQKKRIQQQIISENKKKTKKATTARIKSRTKASETWKSQFIKFHKQYLKENQKLDFVIHTSEVIREFLKIHEGVPRCPKEKTLYEYLRKNSF